MLRRLFTLILLSVLLQACYTSSPASKKAARQYKVALWQHPVEDAYGTLMVSRPPVPLANKISTHRAIGKAPLLEREFLLEAKNTSLDNIAKMIERSTNYKTYCSSLIADQRLSFKRVGSIESHAQYINNNSNAEVVIDKDRLQIWFFEKGPARPVLYEGEVLKDEHKSDH